MSKFRSLLNVLIISSNDQLKVFLDAELEKDYYGRICHCTTFGRAKRLMVDEKFDIIIINTPIEDDFGVQSAIDMASDRQKGILLLVKSDIFHDVEEKVELYGIQTLKRPTTKAEIINVLRIMRVFQYRILNYAQEADSLKTKMKEINVINRAKLILVDRLKLSESEAHRYIEKQAMDNCVKRITIAENIIKTYEL